MSDWPYKLDDYSERYVAHLVREYGSAERALEMLAFFEQEPEHAPEDMLEGGEGAIITFDPGSEGHEGALTFIGSAYHQIAVDAAGDVYFNSTTGADEEQVAERINWCRKMCKSPFRVQSWPVPANDSPDPQRWYVILSSAQDAAAFKLVFGGAQ
ncbi:hypothetical protein [Sphingomonas sp. Ag1]|uniref:hypothetical protein n=1 Tax=Sphingomonas sp. Ag1 TaxID=1642949 RepID=UPI000621D0DD|nr:hypothetical protein [Sphingomonas sp. Ag1]KKI22240.1 hypothetical protein XM50_00855 [Sphingomonas sp. Ag1]